MHPIAKLIGAGLAVLVTSLCLSSGPASAADETDADFQAYCREKFNNSAYRAQPQSWGVDHYCMQGGTPQTIDLAEACEMTTGSTQYRKDGLRVLCSGDPQPETAAQGTEPDFPRYCRETYANSSYESRAEASGIVHYCRIPGATGGFTLSQIDLAEACRISAGVPDFVTDGNRIVCGDATGLTEGTYVFPQMGFTYHGPLKDGLPHGIGWMAIPPTGSTWLGEYRNGELVGPHLQRRGGTLQCWNYDDFAAGKVLPELPMGRCEHLVKRMSEIP